MVSIIIPTYNSDAVLPICLAAIASQTYPKKRYETIVIDNYSTDRTVEIATSLGAKVFMQTGQPSQACAQRNLGARHAKGEYFLFLDHDMEIDKNLLQNFAQDVKATHGTIGAWYIPEKVMASNRFLSAMGTFEKTMYNGTVVNAVRIIKKEAFNRTEHYDERLSNGPADWDMDLQLRKLGYTFGMIDSYVVHHQNHVPFISTVTKKGIYIAGLKRYRAKWRKKDPLLFKDTVEKQCNPWYRTIGIFLENGKWKLTLTHLHLYVGILLTKIFVGVLYLQKRTLLV